MQVRPGATALRSSEALALTDGDDIDAGVADSSCEHGFERTARRRWNVRYTGSGVVDFVPISRKMTRGIEP